MTARERALLRGRDLKPQTEDEAAIKAAVKGGTMVVRFSHSEKTDKLLADKSIGEIIAAKNRGEIIVGIGAVILQDETRCFYLDTAVGDSVLFRSLDQIFYRGDRTSGTDEWTREYSE